MKKLLILFAFLLITLVGTSQTSPWAGFLKPLPKDQLQGEAKYSLGAMTPLTHEIKFRPQAAITAFQVDLKSGITAPFSSAGLGVFAQWYYKQPDGSITNPFGVGLLVLIGKETVVPDPLTLILNNKQYATLDIALPINIYGWINIGPMYDTRSNRFLALLNISIQFHPE